MSFLVKFLYKRLITTSISDFAYLFAQPLNRDSPAPLEWIGVIPTDSDVPLCVDPMVTLGNHTIATRTISAGTTMSSLDSETIRHGGGNNQTQYGLHGTTGLVEGNTSSGLVTTVAGE